MTGLALGLALLVGLVAAVRPDLLTSGGGKAFGFIALFALPILATMMGTSAHLERSKTVEFCTSCHVMKKYGESLRIDDPQHLPAAHFQNGRVSHETACYACHTNYTMYGDLNDKLRGLRHVYAQYLGKIPERIHLYTPYNNRECLHCHGGARNFAEASAHRESPDMLAKIRSNGQSCLGSACHPMTHDVGALAKLKLWSPGEAPK
jgi:cytochrome c-type protein NapC